MAKQLRQSGLTPDKPPRDAAEWRAFLELVEKTYLELDKVSREVEQQHARAANAAKLATLGEMAGGLAHEINTPLGTIQLLASLLRDGASEVNIDRDSFINMAQQIEATVQRISKIVKGLRTFAREGDDEPYAAASVRRVIEDALDLVREKMRARNIDLRIANVDPVLFIECRPVQIMQILMSLISNAVDAMEATADKWIAVDVRDLQDNVEIAVSDGGPGIPNELREKIMQPFFTTKEVGKGTGIGLSISKGLADQHQGSLTLDTSAKHTRFVLRLPKKHSHPRVA